MRKVKKVLLHLGLPIVLGLPASILMIMFIEGSGPGVSVATAVVAFGLAGLVTGWLQRRFLWYAPLLICQLWLTDLSSWDPLVIRLLVAPWAINEYNFYALLPLISLLSAFLCTWAGALLRHAPKTA